MAGGKPGRESKFKPEFVDQVQKLCRLGATDAEVADFFAVDRTTVWRWGHAHPEFAEAMTLGKGPADDRVERSLYHRAIGYEHPEDKIFIRDGEPVVVPTVKHYPPDTTAAIFWLKNRRPDLWRDRHEHTGADGEPLVPEADLDVAKAIAFLLTKAARTVPDPP